MGLHTKYYVKDIYEAAFLVICGRDLKELTKDRGQSFYWFVFDDPDFKCQSFSNIYLNSKTPIKTYVDAVKTLRERLFSKSNYESK